ncbi:toll/interleukin-1 receptor domain-containing protein [Bacillus thuringiensis]|uniref:toll/interleukin-1 receptor domain-containing protein n=1 Tax=Bacillus thuringiensis TaxID=1428 RepID=UPI0034577712
MVYTAHEMVDFFISYNHKDETMAEWIAWILEDAGYTTFIQAWDFKSGNNFILQMDKGSRNSKHTIALLSSNYMESLYTQPEWSAAFVKDPTGENQKLIPVRIEDINLDGLFPSIIYVDLVNKDENSARKEILNGIQTERKKPKIAPSFPGKIPKKTEQVVRPSENWYEEFVNDRIKKTMQGNFMLNVTSGPKVIIHIVPLESIEKKKLYKVSELEFGKLIRPPYSNKWEYGKNKDGYYTSSRVNEKELPHGYVQFYRNGCIESVSGSLLGRSIFIDKPYIVHELFEQEIINHIYDICSIITKKIAVNVPIAIQISLLNANGYYISKYSNRVERTIQDDLVKLQSIILRSWESSIDKALRPAFDNLWNICGFGQSPNYDSEGNWRCSESINIISE